MHRLQRIRLFATFSCALGFAAAASACGSSAPPAMSDSSSPSKGMTDLGSQVGALLSASDTAAVNGSAPGACGLSAGTYTVRTVPRAGAPANCGPASGSVAKVTLVAGVTPSSLTARLSTPPSDGGSCTNTSSDCSVMVACSGTDVLPGGEMDTYDFSTSFTFARDSVTGTELIEAIDGAAPPLLCTDYVTIAKD